MPRLSRALRCSRNFPALALLLCLCITVTAAAQVENPQHLPPEVLRANQEIDRKFLEGHRVLDTGMIMELFTKSPDIFFIGPTGVLYQGRDAVSQSIEKFFSRVVTMTGVIDHVTYLPAGSGVIAYGQVTYHRQLQGQPPDTRVVVWTDYRRKENGNWVLVFRHAHWPLAGNSLPNAKPAGGAGEGGTKD
jgi:ketosteroid isomerase-like protein